MHPDPETSSDRAVVAFLSLRRLLRERPSLVFEAYAFLVIAAWVVWLAMPGDQFTLGGVAFGTFARIGEPAWIVVGSIVLGFPCAAIILRRLVYLTWGSVCAGLWSCFMAGSFYWAAPSVVGVATYSLLAVFCFSPVWLRAAGLLDKS